MPLRTLKRWLAHARERLWRATRHLRNLRDHFPGQKKAKKKKVKQEIEKREETKDKLALRVERRKAKPHDAGGGVPSSAWGGSQAVGEAAVVATSARFGAPITSRKRAASDPLSISNPSSDHNEANTTAYAWDLGTFNGADLAHAVARALNIGGYSTGNYNGYIIARNGVNYRVQILWAVSGHFNHVHVGIRRA